MIIVEFKDGNGKTIAVMVAQPKNFKTGSRGFYAMGKVEIGSKPKEEPTATAESR